MDFETVSEEQLNKLIDVFLASFDDVVISDGKFDEIFDHSRSAIETIGTFSEGQRDGKDFVSSRYVDQIPYVGVSGTDLIPVAQIIKAGTLAQQNPPSRYVLVVSTDSEQLAFFPDRIVGTPTSV